MKHPTPSTSGLLPRQAARIDGLQFARGGLQPGWKVNGRAPEERLHRLVEMGCRTEGLDYSIEGVLSEGGKPALRVRVSGSGRMACQRCLEPVVVDLSGLALLELSESVGDIERADDDVDRVLAEQAMDAERLAEDEAILRLPMVPRHDLCVTVEITGAEEVPLGKAASPFAALAALKSGRKN